MFNTSQSLYSMDKTKKKQHRKRRHYREKKGKIFKNKENGYL